MKRLLAFLFLACLVPVSRASAADVSLGVSLGTTSPSETVDGTDGMHWNLRAPMHLVPLVMVEPFFAQATLGDQDFSAPPVSFTLKGATFTTVGTRVGLSFGDRVSVQPYLGVGWTRFKYLGYSESKLSYLGGLGLSVGLIPRLRLDARAEQHTVPLDLGSRGMFNLSLGVSTPLVALP